jgi:hypothetical protein
MGEFCNELHLHSSGNMKEAFIRAKLLSRDEAHHQEDIDKLLRCYVVEQLTYIPGGSRKFDSYLVAANSALQQGLLQGTLPLDDIPPCLYTHVQQETDVVMPAFKPPSNSLQYG